MRLASKAKFGLMFAMHQVIVFWVVIASAGILAASIFNVLQLFGWLNANNSFNWVFYEIDYFPAFTMLALALGWLLGRSLRDPSMIWVWIFPTLLLVHALVEIPTITPQLVSPAFQAGVGQSRFFHYFGWGCRLGNYCLDQSTFTRPFYAGVAYSLGALAAMKTFKPSQHDARTPFWTPLVVGLLFFACSIYDTINSVRAAGWNWQFLPLEGTSAAMGLYLILLALSAQNKAFASGESADPDCSVGELPS
jgi:hypothetical protein